MPLMRDGKACKGGVHYNSITTNSDINILVSIDG
jgi:hypothetical protein